MTIKFRLGGPVVTFFMWLFFPRLYHDLERRSRLNGAASSAFGGTAASTQVAATRVIKN